jgi:hypothetical protein
VKNNLKKDKTDKEKEKGIENSNKSSNIKILLILSLFNKNRLKITTLIKVKTIYMILFKAIFE